MRTFGWAGRDDRINDGLSARAPRPRARRGPLLAGVAVLTGALLLGAAPGAWAQTACGSGGTFSNAGAINTCTYQTTGQDTFTVPDGVSAISVVAIGGAGGNGGNQSCCPGPVGGRGARAAATLHNATGTLQVQVGANGANGNSSANADISPPPPCPGGTGGTNGGGTGGAGFSVSLPGVYCIRPSGGGGGGASDVRLPSGALTGLSGDPRLVVAGGGGGAAGSGWSDNVQLSGAGGAAGDAAIGGAGNGGASSCTSNIPAGAGGAGGLGAPAGTGGGSACGAAQAGADGVPGDGGSGAGGSQSGGGGGGGGFFGGGGGAGGTFAGGGGGGSSFWADGATDTSLSTTTEAPQIVISWTAPGYAFAEFFAPIDDGGVYNVVKAGQGVPVKFSLGGDQGLNILAAGSPTSQPIACDSSAPSDTLEQTVTAGASSLSYDPTTDTYTYTWKTDKTWATTSPCRKLTVTLTDGSTHTARFKFTR